MKKRIISLFILFVIIVVSLYFYLYQKRADISSMKPDYSVTVKELQQDLIKNTAIFNKKYLDKIIEVNGKITSKDESSHGIILDNKLSAVFEDTLLTNLPLQKQVKVKGRFIGYDDLIEEFKMVEVSLSK